MGGRVNKFGLKDSDLKENQKRKIRQDAGYGCVICGALFVQYEHIAPEFHEAKEHNPEKMTLLCGSHHEDVTHRRISKKAVWEAKANPKNKKGDQITRSLYHQDIDTKVIVGSNSFGDTAHKIFESILTIRGKPVLWFESDFDINSPVEVCAIFHGKDGKPHSFISRNVFSTRISDYDIKGKGSRITISENGSVILTINFEGDKTLKIERLKMSYKDVSVSVNTNNTLKVTMPTGSLSSDTSQFGNLVIYDPKATRRISEGVITTPCIAVNTVMYGVRVMSFNGTILGWTLGGMIINKNYLIVASIKGEDRGVYDLDNEYIGFIFDDIVKGEHVLSIVTKENHHQTGEPIWFIPAERKSKNVTCIPYYDVGYRVFMQDGIYP